MLSAPSAFFFSSSRYPSAVMMALAATLADGFWIISSFISWSSRSASPCTYSSRSVVETM